MSILGITSFFFFYNSEYVLVACNPIIKGPLRWPPAAPIGSPRLPPYAAASLGKDSTEINGLQAALQKAERRKSYPSCTKSTYWAGFAQPSPAWVGNFCTSL